ncbi:hypothetical protein N5D79_08445 [Pseudomonas sp. GD03817]|uniref:hypothetical protein n=1 Tax=unclassified Pseudomonas TaxID=196821 RepID=UPI00244811E8|nr:MULTISPECIES: hypothetical protein [unclassified Pseudomonas]MDH1401241.1 hypothetical protein [Pseudomonas sp. GD03730]MDH1774905.1 hypothetical protein [Pseudomonas sp. GD03817]
MNGVLSYHGPADLTLTYGTSPGLGRTAERPGVEVVVRRPSAGAPVSVKVGRYLGVDLLKGFDLTRAVVALPDGTVLEGAVQAVSGSGDSFEIAAVSQPTQGERYA